MHPMTLIYFGCGPSVGTDPTRWIHHASDWWWNLESMVHPQVEQTRWMFGKSRKLRSIWRTCSCWKKRYIRPSPLLDKYTALVPLVPFVRNLSACFLPHTDTFYFEDSYYATLISLKRPEIVLASIDNMHCNALGQCTDSLVGLAYLIK